MDTSKFPNFKFLDSVKKILENPRDLVKIYKPHIDLTFQHTFLLEVKKNIEMY